MHPSDVCDPDGYLQAGSGESIQKALNALQADYEVAGCGGYEMAVAIVGHAERGGSDRGMELFAKNIMDRWGVGKRACSNGIVLAIAVRDRKMHLATGKGARDQLSDKQAAKAIERMKDLLRASNYGGAVEQCVSDVAKVLSGEDLASSDWVGCVVFVVVVAGVLASIVHREWSMTRYRKCQRVLKRIEQERAKARAEKYQVESCPICLELFADNPALKTVLIRCGHTFHEKCLQDWERVSRSQSCPVCRQPMIDQAEDSPRSQSLPLHPTSHDEEYRFRLSRAHHMYPRYVTNDMVGRWSAPDFSGSIVADTAFIRSSPNYQVPSAGGSSSGGSSFGGGCSSGGGGAGGSW